MDPPVTICNEEKPSIPTSSGSKPPPPSPPPQVPFEWSMELKAELMESIAVNANGKDRIFQVDRKSAFAPLKVFTCYAQFCKRAFNGGSPPKECTIAEFERKMLEELPPSMCKKADGTRALFQTYHEKSIP